MNNEVTGRGPRVISICLFRHAGRVLVSEGYDTVKGSYYYRPLGGSIEFGETAREATVREVREEIGHEIADVRLLGVLENLFVCNGVAGHEIVFVNEGRFTDESVYLKDALEGREDGQRFRVIWKPLDSFDEQHRLVPEGLRALLE